MTSSRCRDLLRRACVPLALAGACMSPTVPGRDVELLPAASEFVLRPDGVAVVHFSVRNAGAAQVLVTRCGDRINPAIERRESGGWANYAYDACQANLDMSPVPLAPGEVRSGTVSLGQAGDYRLVLGTDGGPVISVTFAVR